MFPEYRTLYEWKRFCSFLSWKIRQLDLWLAGRQDRKRSEG